MSGHFGLEPSFIFTSANSGRNLDTSSSSESLPSSMAHMMAAPVKVFVIEKIAKSVSGVIFRFPRSAHPTQSNWTL